MRPISHLLVPVNPAFLAGRVKYTLDPAKTDTKNAKNDTYTVYEYFTTLP